jgi:hypothetical protein
MTNTYGHSKIITSESTVPHFIKTQFDALVVYKYLREEKYLAGLPHTSLYRGKQFLPEHELNGKMRVRVTKAPQHHLTIAILYTGQRSILR